MNGTYSYIREITTIATRHAKENGYQPTYAKDVLRIIEISHRYELPLLGEYIPQGWELVEEWFVKWHDMAQSNQAHDMLEIQRRLERMVKEGYGEERALALMEPPVNGLAFVRVYRHVPSLPVPEDVIG